VRNPSEPTSSPDPASQGGGEISSTEGKRGIELAGGQPGPGEFAEEKGTLQKNLKRSGADDQSASSKCELKGLAPQRGAMPDRGIIRRRVALGDAGKIIAQDQAPVACYVSGLG
jgi:hypothetical protein